MRPGETLRFVKSPNLACAARAVRADLQDRVPALSILFVDDDVELCALMREYLGAHGYTVFCAYDGVAGLERALGGGYDLVILDVMLPQLDGFAVLRKLRQQASVPVVMLTARAAEEDRIGGLNAGADDYLLKPFAAGELLARIRALLRRAGLAKHESPAIVETGGLRLNMQTGRAWAGETPIDLTPTEFEILELLMRSSGRVVSRDEITGVLYQRQATAYERSVDVHLSHLRKKLERQCGRHHQDRAWHRLSLHGRDLMRSLSARMLLAALGTLVVSFIAFVIVFFVQSAPQIDRLIRQFQTIQLEEAVAALKRGGPTGAAEYVTRLSRAPGVTYYLTDAGGRDLISGADRSALVHSGIIGKAHRVGDHVALTQASPDGRFYLTAFAVPAFNLLDVLPYYLVITAAVVLLWWLLAVGIASPIRQLTSAVDRFGRGDLASRARVTRSDEIGNLGRAFNDMAERIQTLLTAERRLLQDISHELRSPLTRLSLGVELLRTTPDREHAIRRLDAEVERLTALVGSLIEVTRSEGDPASRKSELVDLGALVREVVESCRIESDPRDCCILFDDTTAARIVGDPELIRRAVENVVRNAIRHAPPKTAIDVRISEDAADAVVSVRDTGPGVPGALLPRLTDPFFRVDDARSSNMGGVGLGLAIARRAVLLHHGTLVAENANPGLRVTLTIPHRDASASGAPSAD